MTPVANATAQGMSTKDYCNGIPDASELLVSQSLVVIPLKTNAMKIHGYGLWVSPPCALFKLTKPPTLPELTQQLTELTISVVWKNNSSMLKTYYVEG